MVLLQLAYIVPLILFQARETLRVIMERQKKQRDDMISQVQKYGLFFDFFFLIFLQLLLRRLPWSPLHVH